MSIKLPVMQLPSMTKTKLKNLRAAHHAAGKHARAPLCARENSGAVSLAHAPRCLPRAQRPAEFLPVCAVSQRANNPLTLPAPLRTGLPDTRASWGRGNDKCAQRTT